MSNEHAIVPYSNDDDDAASETSVESVHKEEIKMDSLFEDAPGGNSGPHTWSKAKGGLDSAARAKGIPVDQLEDKHMLPELLARIERLDKMTASKLNREYESLGYVADDLMCREELVGLVRDAHIWNELKLSALQDVCAKRGLEIDMQQPRDELLQLLADNMWEEFGIPVSRFPSIDVARKVLEQVRGLENCSISELMAMCKRWGLPTDTRARVTPDELVGQLKRVFIWKQLPLQELRRDCKSRSLSSDVDASLSEDSARRELCERLVASIQSCTPEKRGIPVDRLESAQQAEELLKQVDRLQNLGTLSLKAECYKLNVVYNPVMESQSLVDRLRDVLIWKHLPRESLEKECQQRKIFVLPGDPPDVLINSLLEAQDRAVEMEELGVPTQLLGDEEAANELLEQWKSIEMMGTQELLQWYDGMGLPLAGEMGAKEIQSLLKKAMAWEVLSLADLRQECSKLGVPAAADGDPEDEDEEEQQLIQQSLVHKLLLHETIEVMNTELLSAWYGSMGLPSLEGADRATVQKLLRKILAWESSPLSSLLQDCEKNGVPIGEATLQPEEEEQQQVLSRRLVLHECLEVMTTEALREWYESLGLPPGRGVKRPELQRILRKVLYWQVLSSQELEEECSKAQVETGELSASEEDEEQQQQFLLNKLALSECIEVLSTDDLVEWYEGMGFPLVKGIKRKELQKVLKKVMNWEALPLDDLRQQCAELQGAAVDASVYSDEEQRHSMLQQLVLHERIEGMSPMDLTEWYKGTGLPVEKGMKRTDLQKLLRSVMSWRALPLMDLQTECEKRAVPFEDAAECDEDEQRGVLVDRLFFDDRMEAWDARGFQAKRIGSIDNACQVVMFYNDFEHMDDMQLRQGYAEAGLPEERNMERADCLETLKSLLIWQALPNEELLKDCEERCLDVPSDCSDEQRPELISQLVMDLRLKKKPQGAGRLGGRARLPRALEQKGLMGEGRSQASASRPNTRPQPRAPSPEAEPEVLAIVDDAAATEEPPQEEPASAFRRTPAVASRAAGTRSRFPRRLRESGADAPAAPKPADAGEAPGSVGSQVPRGPRGVPAAEGAARDPAREAAVAAHPRLRDGVALFINLDRREDRKQRMEQLAAPHPWLSASMQRISAVDGRGLDWKDLVDNQLFTRQAAATAQRAVKEKRATIGSTPLECSSHLTLGGCGCALSHRKAWETLVESTSRWALILEDDLNGVCENFDDQLDRVFQLLPGDWNMCYLGFHSGKLLQPGTQFRGPLKQLRATDGWLPGLWGYLISKGCARQLLRQAFPMAAQVDTEVGCRVSQKPGCFMVPEKEFLLFSPPTEASKDTDVQTFQVDMR